MADTVEPPDRPVGPLLTCAQLAAGIRLLEQTYLPRDSTKLIEAEALLQQLIDEGLAGPPLDNFRQRVDNARDNLAFDRQQLLTYRSDYEFAECRPKLGPLPAFPALHS